MRDEEHHGDRGHGKHDETEEEDLAVETDGGLAFEVVYALLVLDVDTVHVLDKKERQDGQQERCAARDVVVQLHIHNHSFLLLLVISGLISSRAAAVLR